MALLMKMLLTGSNIVVSTLSLLDSFFVAHLIENGCNLNFEFQLKKRFWLERLPNVSCFSRSELQQIAWA
jgi:hypothetical protein